MLVKLTLFLLPRLTKSCGLTDKCANDLTCNGEKNALHANPMQILNMYVIPPYKIS